jgi:hypothetical protein
MHLSSDDRAALEFAFNKIVRGPDRNRAEQVTQMVTDESWEYAARFCAGLLQIRALGLRPWETPPAEARPGRADPASRLLDRMLEHGFSRFYHDPTIVLVGPSAEE